MSRSYNSKTNYSNDLDILGLRILAEVGKLFRWAAANLRGQPAAMTNKQEIIGSPLDSPR